MVGIPVWSHCYNLHSAAYDSVRFGCEQLIHGLISMSAPWTLWPSRHVLHAYHWLFATWYSTYPPVYVPEIHDRFPGDTLVEKELQRNYDCLREAKRRGVVFTIGSDSFSFVTPYGYVTIARCTTLWTRWASRHWRPLHAPRSMAPRWPIAMTKPVLSRWASAPICWL